MATAPLDLANQALGRLGLRNLLSSVEEQSAEAEHVRRFYDPTIRTTLAVFDWRFASAIAALAPVGTAPAGWMQQYALPADCLVPRGIVSPYALRALLLGPPEVLATQGQDIVPFAIGTAPDAVGVWGPVVWTDLAGASLRYTRLVTEPGLWEPMFEAAFTWALAAELAVPLTGKADLQQAMLQGRAAMLGQAAVNTAQGVTLTAGHEPEWIAGRG